MHTPLRWLHNLQCFFVHYLHNLKNLERYFKLNKYREIYLPTIDETYHTSTTYIHKTHKKSYAGKHVVFFINMKI